MTSHPLELYAKPQRLVTLPNGRKMNILCSGSGSPTVLLEAGFGYNNWQWTPVQRRVAQTNRVCSYDRAGLGFSDFAIEPRTPANIAADLTSLLKVADIKGPFVMVGHSAGGMHARAFVDMHRREVVGMVLVDPVGLNQNKRFEAEIPADVQRHAESRNRLIACAKAAASGALQKPSPPEAVKSCLYEPMSPTFPAVFNAARKRIQESPAYFQTLLSEDAEESATQVASAPGSYGDLPLIVFTVSNSGDGEGLTAEEVAKFKKIWNSMHEEITALSSRGIHRQIPDASHNFVTFEKPDLIAAAISELIAAAAK
jgi:pimeloyl-ACP methyl ester carboxylesterase